MKRLLIFLMALPLLSFTSDSNPIDIVGTWVAGKDSSITYIKFESDGYATMELDGVLLEGRGFSVNGKKGNLTYKIDFEKEPIEVDFILTLSDSDEQTKILCIIKFEDENTMLLATNDDDGRPTEFNSANTGRLRRAP